MTEGSIVELILLAFLGSIAGLIGSVIYFINVPFSRRFCGLAVPFAAGVLLTVSILDLIPESAEIIGESAFLIVLISFLAAFLFEQFFTHLHHHEHRGHTMTKTSSIPLVLAGDTIHNFIDGVAIGSAYVVDPAFGLIVSLSTFLHETPHEIGDFGILVSSGWSRFQAFLANAASASTTFLGALAVYFFILDNPSLEGAALAISGGLFLYLGATDFLPTLNEQESRRHGIAKIAVLFAGVVIMATVILGIPHASV